MSFLGEFDLISRYFMPLTQGRAEAQSLRNDGAVLRVPCGKELVVTTDTLVSGLHFFADQSPETIAQKALRTNLSDIAAMGAVPYCYQLALSLPPIGTVWDESWMDRFALALSDDQKRYGVFLSGGDTTGVMGGGTVISITAFGLVDQGRAVTRSGAQAGDRIILSGNIGAAFCGLEMLCDLKNNTKRSDMQYSEYCVQRYYTPEPPVDLGVDLPNYVHAALDVSDGLLADVLHMAKASGLRAEIDMANMCFAPDVQHLLDCGVFTHEQLLSGGDDYELVMAVPPENCEKLLHVASKKDIILQDVGAFSVGDISVALRHPGGRVTEPSNRGWQHF